MVTLEDMLAAHYDCRRHKRHSVGAMKYFMGYEEDLLLLTDEINNRTYRPSTSTAFVVTEPRPREVFAACFRDRVVHHYIALRVEPIFENIFGERTFNCRKWKGQIFGVNMLREDIRQCSENYSRDCWIMKLDLQGFFMSIQKKFLRDMLLDYIGTMYKGDDKDDLLWLIDVVVTHSPEKNCARRSPMKKWGFLPANKSLFTCGEGLGLPIGNLSSQLFANFFLFHLDDYLEKTLGFTHHGRYVDDFYIIHTDKDYMLSCVPKIRSFLDGKLHIRLHPHKFYLQHYSKGVAFTGSIVKFERVYSGRRTLCRYRQAMRRLENADSPDTLAKVVESVNSYLGFMVHGNSYGVRREAFSLLSKRVWGRIYVEKNFGVVRKRRKWRCPPLPACDWPKVYYARNILYDEKGNLLVNG